MKCIAVLLAGVLLSACRKDYTCRCVTTTGNQSVSTPADTTQRVYKNIHRRDARTLCGDKTFTSLSTGTVNIGSSYTYTRSVVKEKKCQLH